MRGKFLARISDAAVGDLGLLSSAVHQARSECSSVGGLDLLIRHLVWLLNEKSKELSRLKSGQAPESR